MTTLRWTRTKPTKPGWYWLHDKPEDAGPVKVVRHGGRRGPLCVDWQEHDSLSLVSKMDDDLEWSDAPIPEPEE